MDTAAEDQGNTVVRFQSVGKALRTVIVSFFSSVLVIHSLAFIFSYCFHKFAVSIQHTDSVLDHHHTFAETLCARSCNDGFVFM